LGHHISVTKVIKSNSKIQLKARRMKKRAVIEVSLVPESADTLNSQIEKEIRKEASIPWVEKVVKVTVIERQK